VEGLQVTSRTSAFAFKGKLDDIREIAVKLNVDKILEGSVRKASNRVRITAQLINAADGYNVWSENYDRDLTDIFQVQDEISNIIANRLRENLSLAEQKGTW
jgi:TolB-like protein